MRISPGRRGRVGWSDRRSWRGPSSTRVRGIEMVAPFEDLCLLSLRVRGVGEREAFLPGAAAARGQPRGQVGVRHRGRVRGHRAAGPGRRPLRRPAARAPGGRPGRRGHGHRLPRDRPFHRRLRRRPAPRRRRAAALPAQRDRRAGRDRGADPGQLGHVQPAPAAVHPAPPAHRGPQGPAGGAPGAGRPRRRRGRVAGRGADQPLRGLHGQPAGGGGRAGRRGRAGDRSRARSGSAPTCST